MTEQKSSVTTESKSGCSQVQRLLPGYLRHELTAVQRHQIQTHLTHCNRCAQRVHEARLLDADLQAEADRQQPHLSRAAALRIQNQVYRRMRRSLVWHRAGQVVRLSTAVTVLALLLAGSFLFGRFWLPSLTSPASDAAASGQTTTVPETVPTPTAVPTPQPATPQARPTVPVKSAVENGRPHAWEKWNAAAPGQTPEQLAATIMNAALARDAAYLDELFIGLGAASQPTAQLWLRVGNRCPKTLTAVDFLFTRRSIPLLTVTSVSIWYDQHLVGEIKMRQVRGDWFATFTRTPSFNPCLSR